jgi:SAM-dependent methyltransferase
MGERLSSANDVIEREYNVQERGDRIRPKKSLRTYQCLVTILGRLQHIINSDSLSPGKTVLDYGCGSRPYETLFSQKFKDYVGADIAGNPKADLTIGSEGQVPAPNESFDCVLSSQVLEHVVSPQIYLKEAYRVLREGGHLIVSTHGIWPYHPDPTDFWRWTIDGLQREIQRAGFEIVMVQSVFGLESSALQLWQDATYERLPGFLQPLYTRFFQTLIGLIESRHPDKVSNDASVYIVLARRPLSNSQSSNGENDGQRG